MPFTAITYDIIGGCEDEVAAVFDNYKRPGSSVIRGNDGEPAARILATAVFIRDSLLVRFIEYEGDLEAVARFMAVQPGVQEVERKLAPYLKSPRDTGTVDGFVETFRASTLRCVTQLSVPRAADSMIGKFDFGLPPVQWPIGLFTAKWAIGALRALVELGVPDVLADGPAAAADISAATGADSDALYRVLRGVAAAGILDERADGCFALNPVSAGLVSGASNGIRDMFLFASDPMLWRPYENMAHTLRTGQPAFDYVFGMPFYEYTKANAASGDIFDRAMRQNHYPGSDRIFAEFDFGRFERIADIGGGKGQFLAEVLRDHPRCAGVLVDQPHTVADAMATFEASGVADRVTIVPADFFSGVPGDCDAYFIKHTLHNWGDDKATEILRRVREAIASNDKARLLIVDMLLRGPGQWDIGKLIDVEALALLGGRERSRVEWDRITRLAGFAPANDPEPGDLVLLEYRPV